MKAQVAALLSHWHAQGISAIAILAPDVDRVEQWANRLKDASLQILRRGEAYRGGVVLATLDFVRGLEFDAVLLLEVSQEDYPGHDAASARILYTAITRARRTLVILALSQSPSDWLRVIDD
jgi:DNA helicase-2/ATP-dependent DNA helicase PcrA